MVSLSGREGQLSVKKDLGAMGEAQTGNDNERVGPVGARQRPLRVDNSSDRALRHVDF